MSKVMKSAIAVERQLAGSIIGARITKMKADNFALTMKPILQLLENNGITGRTEVAHALNFMKYPSPGGKQWGATTVTNLVGRIAVLKGAA